MQSGTAIVVVTFNSAATICACLKSALATLGPDDEVIVVDNHSQDDTLAEIQKARAGEPGTVRVLPQHKNLGFARACNLGMAHSDKEFVVLLNPDTQVFDNWLERLIAHFQYYPNTGAVGPLSNYTAHSQHVTTYLNELTVADFEHPERLSARLWNRFARRSLPVRVLIGFCLALRRETLERYGGLDETFFLGIEDLELSWRLRERGYWLRVALDVFVEHAGQVSFKTVAPGVTEQHVRQGADRLYEKMRDYYAPAPVPHPLDYFGVGWWQPTILQHTPEEQVFSPRWQAEDHRNLLLNVQGWLRKQETHRARQALLDFLRIFPSDFSAWYTLGSVYLAEKQFPQAEAALQNAAALEFGTSKARDKLEVLSARRRCEGAEAPA